MLYEGGQKLKNFGSNLLLKRPKEVYDVYQERYRRLTYEDILANCVRWYIAKLFATEAKIDAKTEDARFAAFLQDCDRAGTTFATFARNLFECMMLYQAAFVLIDKPQPDADKPPATRADEQAQDLDKPYLVLYQPQQAINWQVDDYGNLDWVIFKAYSERQDDPLGASNRSVNWYVFDKTTYRHYRYDVKESNAAGAVPAMTDPEKWATEADSATLIAGPSPHALAKQNRVPVRVCQFPSSLWFSNACFLQLCEHLDFLNAYAWKLFMSCYAQLVIYSDAEIKGQTLSEVAFLKLGEKDRAEYLEPDGKSFTECANYLERLRMEIYRSFHLQAQAKTSTATADGASGYSKEQDMAPAVDMLNAFGDQMRADQQLILLDYKQAAGLPADADSEPDVNGYRFESKPALQEIALAQSVIDLGLTDKSPTLEQVLDMRVAQAIIDGENEETKSKVTAEIEAAPTRKEAKDADEAGPAASLRTEVPAADGDWGIER